MSDLFEKTYEREVHIPEFPEFGPDYLPESVHTHFHFTPHGDAEHFDEATELLKDTDIFVPELAGWTTESEAWFNSIAKGDRKILERVILHQRNARHDEYVEAMLTSLYGTYKPVIFIDADKSHRELIILDEEKAYIRVSRPEPDETLEGLADVTSSVAEASYARDIIMAQRLGERVTGLVTKHKRLSKNDRVDVLVVLGNAHDTLYQKMSTTDGLQDRTTHDYWAGITGHNIESHVIIKYRNGEAPTHTDLSELLISLALDIASIPTFHPDPLFRFGRHYSRNPHELTTVGDNLVKMMLAMGDDGIGMANRILRKTFTKSDAVTLLDLAVTAREAADLAQ